MTSKILFFNLMKEDMKKRLWTFAIAFLVFFFSFPVRNAMVIANYYSKMNRNYQDLIRDITVWQSFNNVWVAVLLIVLSLIMGVTSFSYLHSKQKVDFYHGIPVSRKVLYWSHYINGILIPVVAYGVVLILNTVVIAVNGFAFANVIGITICSFLFFLLHYIMLYSVTVLAMILTGNILIGILGTGVLHVFSPCLFGVIVLYCNEFWHTRYKGIPFEDTVIYKIIDMTSPFAMFIFHIIDFQDKNTLKGVVFEILFGIVLTVFIAILSYWIYKKRGLEAAGKAMAFRFSMPIIRIPIVILSSLFGSIFFWFMNKSLESALFGNFCGMILSHCVIEIIYHFDFRKLFTHWKQMIGCAVIAIAIFCGFRFDVTGYDKYIPNENSIESVAISIDDMNHWVWFGSLEQYGRGEYGWKYENADDYVFEHMTLHNVSPVLSMVENAINDIGDTKNLENGKRYYFSVKYHFKNGKDKYRTYSLYSDESPSELIEILKTADYQYGTYPILNQTPEETSAVRVAYGHQTDIVSSDKNGTDKAMTENLLLAYQEDFKNLQVETMKNKNPIAIIQFLNKEQAEIMKEKQMANEPWEGSSLFIKGFYPIYPTFERTLGLLEKCHVDVKRWDNREYVNAIVINTDDYRASKYTGTEYDSHDGGFNVDVTITDHNQINQIMKNAMISEYSDKNPFSSEGKIEGNFLNFYAKDEESNMEYIIAFDQLPASLKKKLDKAINQE